MYHAPKIVHDEVYTTTIRATVTDRRTDVSRSSQFLSRPPVVVHFLYHASCIMPRGIGWKRPELEFLLQLIEERLPVGGDEWAKVAELHDKEYPENKRDKE